MQWINAKRFLKGNANIYLCFFIALLIYGVSAGTKINEQSKTPQYIHLANSFLHLKPYLISLPDSTFDLISFKGKWYVPGGMTPALLLMPFVAMFGTNISDVLFGVILGSINVSLVYLLLGNILDSAKRRIWLTVVFGFGTPHWWLASVGSVWFNAQLTAVLFMILFSHAMLKDESWKAGLFFSLAFLARPPIFFSAIAYIIFMYYKAGSVLPLLRKLIPFAIMLIIGLITMLSYNYLRFGNPAEFGYGYVKGTQALTNAYAANGGFSISYMLCNIYISILGLPNIASNPFPDINQACLHLQPIMKTFADLSSFFNPAGMSIFLTTPVFFLLFLSDFRDKLVLSSWGGMITTLIVLWMYHTTGWVQFGYRYILDVAVYIFMILGTTIKHVDWKENVLLGLSVMMGAIGVYLMYYMTFGLVWTEMAVNLLKSLYWTIF